MNYMSESERKWAKDNGLKKTKLKTIIRGHERIVYRANDGRLFYRDANCWHGTFPSYCYNEEEVNKGNEEEIQKLLNS